MRSQPGILAPLPAVGRFLVYGLRVGADLTEALAKVGALVIDDGIVVGLGAPLVAVDGLRPFPALAGPGVAIPSTQGALFAFVRGADPGEVLARARALSDQLGEGFVLDEDVATFQYDGGRDLTGYEDGTENPRGARAAEVALGTGGESFVSVQRWVHDLAGFARRSAEARDAIVGRSRETNEELADAPASAHVKRAAQESFDPPSFLVRRSMPFGDVGEHGLYFVAFGATLDPFERILARMIGAEDGVVDGLFQLSRPVSGGHYLCPPLRDGGKLDLPVLG
ncbi:MAG: Dyp-type peroxidase [Myxococcales bacterium]|nr:Dyp-type peroxidase [Myxococcales bacterium]